MVDCPPLCEINNLKTRKLTSYFKYCTDDEKVISGILKDNKIRFTQPWALNDPLEFKPVIKFNNDNGKYNKYRLNGITLLSLHDFMEFNLIYYQLNKFGFLSMTKIPDSFAMWCHYANGHKGFLIEFKDEFYKHPCMKSKEGNEYPVVEIGYVDDYAINIDESLDESNKLFPDKADDLFYKKISRWGYEEEYRMVRPLSDSLDYTPLQGKPFQHDNRVHLFEFSLDCIESITFGAFMSSENKKTILSYCENTNIEFLQAMISKDEKDLDGKAGKVVIVPLNKVPNILEMNPIMFCYDRKIASPNYIDIKKLSELPYYDIDKSWVEEFYKNRCSRKVKK
jgi:hypothetical protein